MGRLLLAHEGAVFSLSDLWVAAATQNEQEQDADAEQDEQARQDESVFEDDESRLEFGDGGGEGEPDFFGFGTAPPSLDDLRATAALQTSTGLRGYGPPPGAAFDSTSSNRLYLRNASSGRPGPLRRPSLALSSRGPGIFSNTGLNPSSLASAALLSPSRQVDSPLFSALDAIPERAASSNSEATILGAEPGVVVEEEPQQLDNVVSLLRQLPLALIAQYALLALHNTANDQVFMCGSLSHWQ